MFGASTSRSRCNRGPITAANTKPGYTGRQVDHVTTGVVQGAVRREVAAAPDQERIHRIYAGDPEGHVGDPRLEVDPPKHRAEREDRRDRSEHELEVDERGLGEVERRAFGDRLNFRLALLTDVAEHATRFAEERPQEAVLPEDPRATVRDRMTEAHLERPQHHTMSVTQNATNVSIIAFTDQRFCMTPP